MTGDLNTNLGHRPIYTRGASDFCAPHHPVEPPEPIHPAEPLSHALKGRAAPKAKFESRDDEGLCASVFHVSYPLSHGKGGRGDRETNDTAVSLFL